MGIARSGAAGDTSVGGPLSADELFRFPDLTQPALSPNGKSLAGVAADEAGEQHLFIYDLATKKPAGLRGDDQFGIYSFQWIDDDRLLFNVSKDKLYAFGLYIADKNKLDRRYALNLHDVTKIIGLPKSRPDRVLVWLVQDARNGGKPGDLVEIDARRAAPSLRQTLPADAIVRRYPQPSGGAVINWIANEDGELALCLTSTAGHQKLHRFLSGTNSWLEVGLDLEKASPMQLDPDDHFLWLAIYQLRDGYQLRRYNLDTGAMGEPVLTDPAYDLSRGLLLFSEKTRKLAGIYYMQRRANHVWFDRKFEAAQAAVDRAMPDTDNALINSDRAETRLLFCATGPQQPGVYLLVDLEAKTLAQVAYAAPWLRDRPLRPTNPVSFQTRDRVTLEGYLTLPDGASETHPVPLVVLAHGGPWVRDVWQFQPDVQFFASRGYAVLQPNYRGSAGYAPPISRDGQFDFRRMHDDVTDATKAMMRSPVIDPKRVAIVGSSFGGYLALAGVTFERDLYQCAISVCGVFDWESLIKDKRDEGRPGEYEFYRERLGKPGRDRQLFDEISPLKHADQIHVPVLIAHGTEDRIVDISQSKKLAAALKKRGVPYETFFRKLEGHGFFNPKDRIAFYQQVESFLARNLSPAAAPTK